ncbi:MAG: hypothetical protein ACR2PG_04810 [Hyphomicrobiaceae bacterium]
MASSQPLCLGLVIVVVILACLAEDATADRISRQEICVKILDRGIYTVGGDKRVSSMPRSSNATDLLRLTKATAIQFANKLRAHPFGPEARVDELDDRSVLSGLMVIQPFRTISADRARTAPHHHTR